MSENAQLVPDAFSLVALDEGHGVQEYAKRAGVTQSVMTHILFALSSRGRGRERGYGLVQQRVDTKDARKHQTYLTPKGKVVMQEIVRLVVSDEKKLRIHNPKFIAEPARDIAHDQWLSRLVAAGRKLNGKDIILAAHLVETFMRYRQSGRTQYTSR